MKTPLAVEVVVYWTAKMLAQDGSVVDRCSCDDVEEKWQDQEHLVSTVPKTSVLVHFYPDEAAHTVTILRITSPARD